MPPRPAPVPAAPAPTPAVPAARQRRRPARRFSAALFGAVAGALIILLLAMLAGYGVAPVRYTSARFLNGLRETAQQPSSARQAMRQQWPQPSMKRAARPAKAAPKAAAPVATSAPAVSAPPVIVQPVVVPPVVVVTPPVVVVPPVVVPPVVVPPIVVAPVVIQPQAVVVPPYSDGWYWNGAGYTCPRVDYPTAWTPGREMPRPGDGAIGWAPACYR